MAAAWRWAELQLWNYKTRLHEWTLPADRCIESSFGPVIPVNVWQASLPVFRAVVAATREARATSVSGLRGC